MNNVSVSAAPVMPTIIDVFDAERLSLSPGQNERLNPLKQWLHREFPSYLEALQGRTSDSSKVAKTAQVEVALAKAEVFLRPAEKLEALQAFAKVTAHARQLGRSNIAFPSLATGIREPKNRFAKRNLREQLGRVERWQKLIDAWIPETVRRSKECESLRELSPCSVSLECVLLSAVLYGGLIHVDALIALVRALGTCLNSQSLVPSSALHLYGNSLCVHLPLSWQGVSGAEQRVWYPDSLTAMLLQRLRLNDVNSLTKAASRRNLDLTPSDAELKCGIWGLLSSAFRSPEATKLMSKLDRPRSWTDLFDTVALAGGIEWPAVCVEYASRRVRSHSLKPATLARIFGQAIPAELDGKQAPEQDSPVWRSFDDKQADDNSDVEPAWLMDIRSAFRGKQKTHAQSRHIIEQLLGVYREPTAARRMAEFSYRLLKQRSPAGNPLAISTIRSSVITVSKRFGCLLGEEDPSTFSIEDLETLYTQVLSDADPEGEHPGLRRNVARSLDAFHSYLVVECAQPPLRRQEILGIGRGVLPVDANLINPEEYQRALDHLAKRFDLSPELKRILRLVLILGFTCGLRRMEVLGLQVSDLCEKHPSELLIRPCGSRRLKTKSATRKLPLFALLSQQELAELCQWKTDRSRWAPANNSFLFTLPGASGMLSADLVFPNLHQAMRETTGDAGLHYHHLRHSFATWTFLRLMHSRDATFRHPLLQNRQDQEWLQEASTLSSRLYQQEGELRRHVYAVALLLGHSSPQITLEHYVHGLDGLLAEALSRSSFFQPTSHTLMRASGLAPATFFRWQNEESTTARVAVRIYRKTQAEILSPGAASVLPEPAINTNSKGQSWIERSWHFLCFQQTTSAFHSGHHADSSLYELAEQYGWDSAAAVRILQRARTLQQLRSARGRIRHRWARTTNSSPSREEKSILCCPLRPPPKQFQQIVNVLSPAIQRLFQEDPASVKAVLNYYVQNVSAETNQLSFSSVQEAGNYLSFLRALGLRQSQIQLESGQPQHWKKSLRLTNRYTWKTTAAPKRLLLVEPLLEEKGVSGAGFRFLMVMAAIGAEDMLPKAIRHHRA